MTDSSSDDTARFSAQDPDALCRPDWAAKFLDVTPRTLEAWRHRGGGPPFVRISSRAIRYRRRDLIAWAAERLRSNTGEG